MTLRGPVRRVHIDQSYSASEQRVSHHLPEEAEQLLQRRFQIINVRSLRTFPGRLSLLLVGVADGVDLWWQVWRPIKTILKDPLGVCDAHSVPETDLVGAALVYPDRRGETYAVRPNPGHRWYYKYGQRPDEGEYPHISTCPSIPVF